MEKYLHALNEIESSDPPQPQNQTMKNYMKVLQEIKDERFNNISISKTSIYIIAQNTMTKHAALKHCLIKMAINSLAILSKIKNITIENIIVSNTKLFEKKNADYGNSFADFELIGIIVRLNDKINRILNLGEAPPEIMQVNEKIEDTINDLYNYCVIGLMYT